MSLRDEILQLIRWELSENKTIQRAFEGDAGGLTFITHEEHLMLTFKVIGAYRVAMLRLADEIDALKLDTGE